uniref:Uncharacterized protein n=1 Tax=Pipistrellus kuhlii TaxID=59472 RepID=A0A7J7W333_PIPKU|nr:hypothetical protein mPipKuh1_008138 [Pipistrellus kuhlii]
MPNYVLPAPLLPCQSKRSPCGNNILCNICCLGAHAAGNSFLVPCSYLSDEHSELSNIVLSRLKRSHTGSLDLKLLSHGGSLNHSLFPATENRGRRACVYTQTRARTYINIYMGVHRPPHPTHPTHT